MKTSLRRSLLLLAALSTGAASVALSAGMAQGPSRPPAADVDSSSATQLVERGRYLVHDVAMCVQCHSPRDRRGRLLEDRLLEGGPVPVQNPYPGRRWAFQAPHIANAPGYTREELIRLLTEGIRRSGDRPSPPMPPYRMSPQDAAAIWAYLQSR